MSEEAHPLQEFIRSQSATGSHTKTNTKTRGAHIELEGDYLFNYAMCLYLGNSMTERRLRRWICMRRNAFKVQLFSSLLVKGKCRPAQLRMKPWALIKSNLVLACLLLQRLSVERNTSDSDSVGVSAGENCRENGKAEMHAVLKHCSCSNQRLLGCNLCDSSILLHLCHMRWEGFC